MMATTRHMESNYEGHRQICWRATLNPGLIHPNSYWWTHNISIPCTTSSRTLHLGSPTPQNNLMLLKNVMVGLDSLSVLRVVGEGGSHLKSMSWLMEGVIAYVWRKLRVSNSWKNQFLHPFGVGDYYSLPITFSSHIVHPLLFFWFYIHQTFTAL